MAAIIQKPVFYSVHQLLMHFIWGGVLEKHPNLQLVLTEAGSAWSVAALQSMDYTWEGAFTHRSVKDFLTIPPSEYFRRQCHLGSSVFSMDEMENIDQIGIEQMTIGMDFPHPEGSWGMGPGHLEYLNATLGAAKVQPEQRAYPGRERRRPLGLRPRQAPARRRQVRPHDGRGPQGAARSTSRGVTSTSRSETRGSTTVGIAWATSSSRASLLDGTNPSRPDSTVVVQGNEIVKVTSGPVDTGPMTGSSTSRDRRSCRACSPVTSTSTRGRTSRTTT